MPKKTAYAGYPSAVMYKGPAKKGPVQHLLWGDWLQVNRERRDGWCQAHSRGEDGWLRKESIQPDRLLEVVFVDIGQGDGCLVVTPQDRHIVIDAGEGDNMYRFLRWRYGGFRKKRTFEAAVISHPDQDHYGGFASLFGDENVTFNVVYHNGIVERTGRNSLGQRSKSGRASYLTHLVASRDELKDFLGVPSRWKGKKYPTMLHGALASGRVVDCLMLSLADGFVPGYGPEGDLSMQLLGPVTEPDGRGAPRLRWLGNVGKTKNGHSIVLRLQYRDVSVLLGGDLNIPAENLLLGYHTGMAMPPKTAEQERLVIEAARPIFEVDIAKACHHGSADFSDVYLRATNPIATVISSGDDEPHAHPRADALGAIGRWSRGGRPLIFSTELARSAKESINHPYVLRHDLREAQKQIEQAATPAAKKRAQKRFDKLLGRIDRSIAVYGAINVRTDGHSVVIAQKLERPRSKAKKWDIYQLEPMGNGPLRYVSKY
ncbi:MAG TPA: SH3 domain-containing protein [Phycisphaerae bacterium]|nr:SH3 domain-containing protein [Phycisphaerae bacterium]